MAIITLDGARKAFGAFQALDEVTFTVGAGEKVALVGPNGSGKTTILRMIAGLDAPDTGVVNVLPGTSIGFMPQEYELAGGGPLLEEVSNASGDIKNLEHELRRLESAVAKASADEMDNLLTLYADAQQEYDRLDGYSFDAEVKATLTGLGLGPEHWEKPVDILSGGQKTRSALAKLLLEKPDILLLDEPTNHLDISACEWLERFLQEFPRAVLVVSHDRYFLDKVVSKVVDLQNGCTRQYPGNFTAYTKLRASFIREQTEDFERQQVEIRKLEDFILRYKAGQRSKQARGREKLLNKMSRLGIPATGAEKMRLGLDSLRSTGNIVVSMHKVAKAFGNLQLFSGVDLVIEKGERVAFVGPNGAGKTTLLKIILGEEQPSAGSVTLGYAVDPGYFAQNMEGLNQDNTVLGELLDSADLTPAEARSMLARFLFKGEEVFKHVSALSGGECNRVALAKLIAAKSNFLLLDEPTNHLDIDSRQALGEALESFSGTIVLTSHDRYLLNALATKIVEISAGVVKVYTGNYDYYIQHAQTIRPRPQKKKSKPSTRTRSPNTRKGPSSEQIERMIEEAEAKLKVMTDALSDPELYADHERAARTLEDHQELTAQLEELYIRWADSAEQPIP